MRSPAAARSWSEPSTLADCARGGGGPRPRSNGVDERSGARYRAKTASRGGPPPNSALQVFHHLPVAGEALGVDLRCGGDRAAGLVQVKAVAEAASARVGPNLGEPVGDPLHRQGPLTEVRYPRRVDDEPATGDRVQSRHGGGVPPLLAPAREGADRDLRTRDESSDERGLADARRPHKSGDSAVQNCGERFQAVAGEHACLEYRITDAVVGADIRNVRIFMAQIDLVQHESSGEAEMLASCEVTIDEAARGSRAERGHYQEQIQVGGDEAVPPRGPGTGEHRSALVHRLDDALVRPDGPHGHAVADHNPAEAATSLTEAKGTRIIADLEPAPPAGAYEAVFGHAPGSGATGGIECADAEAGNSIMTQDPGNLIWIDLEMTGLRPEDHHIIEVATVVTDSALEILAHGPDLVIRQPEEVLARMDRWNVEHHSRSGLLDEVRASDCTVAEAERRTVEFVRSWAPSGSSPMCGNSVCQDRRFLYRHMPCLERWFHYRGLDVSTLKILAQRWAPQVAATFEKTGTHRAPDDILESIRELRHYREYLFA